MKAPQVEMIRLREAYLCSDLECNTISTSPYRCPACWSTVQHLGKILNRTEGDKRNG